MASWAAWEVSPVSARRVKTMFELLSTTRAPVM